MGKRVAGGDEEKAEVAGCEQVDVSEGMLKAVMEWRMLVKDQGRQGKVLLDGLKGGRSHGEMKREKGWEEPD
jgi:hypothetical protein